MIYAIRNIITLMCLSLLMAGCSSDADRPDAAVDDAYVDVSLTLMFDDGSRAYDDPLDHDTRLQRYIAVGDIYVVFYHGDGRIAMVPDMNDLGGIQGSRLRTLSGRVPRSDEPLTYRVLANVAESGSIGTTPEEVKASLRAMAADGVTDEDLCRTLTFDGADPSGRWPLDGAECLLPMQSAMSRPTLLAGRVEASLSLYRSVAKIGVEYKGDEANFLLTKVRVYRQNNSGAFISTYRPDESVYTQFADPYIPAGAVPREEYVEYDVTDNALLEQIFVPEFHNTGDADTDMHIMAGGYLDGSMNLLWYDMHFTADGHRGSEPYDVVRNHSYIFRINRVTGNDIELTLNNAWDHIHEVEIE